MIRSLTLIMILGIGIASCQSGVDAVTSTAPDNIRLVVHRGANRLAPENTLASFRKAIEHGAAYVEVDVRMSKDSILYNFHDANLARTTDGTGLFQNATSDYIDGLDAGSWFDPSYAGERVPRIEDLIREARGNVKIYFDVKQVDMDLFLDMLKKEHFEQSCFVWFSSNEKAEEFRLKAPHIPLKMNANDPEMIPELVDHYDPQIIECNIPAITPQLQHACTDHNLKLMANLLRDSWWEYRSAIEQGVDLVNIDHPDYFNSMVQNEDHVFSDYRLVAHRGGVVEGLYSEYDPRSIQAAIDSGYWMLEIDVYPTKDKKLVVHHDPDLRRIYGVDGMIEEYSLDELKKLKALKGGYAPMTFEEVVAMCKNKVRIMMDIKMPREGEWFFAEIKRILETYDLLKSTFFISHEYRDFFHQGRYGFRMQEVDVFREMLENDEPIAAHYYLFDHGNRINAETARWCQENYIEVCASVNVGHYRLENDVEGARRDIQYLKKCGVTIFQIDSQYDEFF